MLLLANQPVWLLLATSQTLSASPSNAFGVEAGCTWPRCVVPVLNARLGASPGSSSAGGASGGKGRDVVSGAVATRMQVGALKFSAGSLSQALELHWLCS